MAHRLHECEAVTIVMTNQAVGNQPFQLLCKEPNHIISHTLAINAVYLLKIVNIHHNNLVGLLRAGIQQKTCMVEERLPGIQSCLGIKLNFRECCRRFPHLDQIPDTALNTPKVIGLGNEVHCPQFQASGLVLRAVAAGGNNDGNGREQRILTGLGKELEAVTDRHIHIQNHKRQVPIILGEDPDSLFAILSAQHIILGREHLHQHFPVDKVILHNQDLSAQRMGQQACVIRLQNAFPFLILAGQRNNHITEILRTAHPCQTGTVETNGIVDHHPVMHRKAGTAAQFLPHRLGFHKHHELAAVFRKDQRLDDGIHHIPVAEYMLYQLANVPGKAVVCPVGFGHAGIAVHIENVAIAVTQHLDNRKPPEFFFTVGQGLCQALALPNRADNQGMTHGSIRQGDFHRVYRFHDVPDRIQICPWPLNSLFNGAVVTGFIPSHKALVTQLPLFQTRICLCSGMIDTDDMVGIVNQICS